MTDWADGIEIRNTGIKCVIDARVLSELVRIIIALGVIAGALLFYSWVRNQIVDIGYQTQRLLEIEDEQLDVREYLILEEEILKNPQNIELFAIHEGLSRLRPNQIVLRQPQVRDSGTSNSLAMAGSGTANLTNPERANASGIIN